MHGEMIQYRLSDDELELARKGLFDQIPTGEMRGLTPTVPDPPIQSVEPFVNLEPKHTTEPPRKREYGRKATKYLHITKEHLQAERAAGKTVDQISADNGIPRGTLTWLFKKHGLVRGSKEKC